MSRDQERDCARLADGQVLDPVTEHQNGIARTARRPFDQRTHHAFDTGWQTLTLCGLRVTWLNDQTPIDPGPGIVDCVDCVEALREDLVYRMGTVGPEEAGVVARELSRHAQGCSEL